MVRVHVRAPENILASAGIFSFVVIRPLVDIFANLCYFSPSVAHCGGTNFPLTRCTLFENAIAEINGAKKVLFTLWIGFIETVVTFILAPILVPIRMYFELMFGLTARFFAWIGKFLGITEADVSGLIGTAKGNFTEWMKDPFRLQTYGDSMRTLQVKRDQQGSTIVLTTAFFFCLIAWWLLFSYTGLNLLFRVVFSVGFAVMEIVIDRFINVSHDKGGWRTWGTIAIRGLLILFLASLNAVPIELQVFAPEIDDVIHDREVAKLDVIRAKALKDAEALVDRQTAAKTATLTGSTKDAVARRAEERAKIEARRPEILARLSAKSDELAAEVGNGVRTGKTGYGPAAKALKVEVDAIRQEIIELDDRLTAFDAATAVLHTSSVGETAKQHAADVVALDYERARITALTPEALVAEFGGEYKEPDGFMARYKILLEIVHGDGAPGWTSNQIVYWGCKALMTAFGIMLLVVKYGMMSVFTKSYYSPYKQALGGDPDSRRLMRLLAQKDKDPEAIEVLALIAENERAEAEAAQAVANPTP